MNNKGMTLVELLVSFLLVGVTIIYFMQAMIDVKRIYKNTQDDTQKYVEKTYAIKIFDACMNNNLSGCTNLSSNYGINFTVSDDGTVSGGYHKYIFTSTTDNAFTFNIYR